MAEFIAVRILDKRLNRASGAAGALRVLVDVSGFKMRSSFPLPGSEPLVIGDAKISFSFRIEDAASGRELARGRVEDALVPVADMDEAKALADLHTAPAGLDIQFRMLAASMNTVSRYVEVVLEQPRLPTSAVRVEVQPKG